MFKRKATELNRQPTTAQQILTRDSNMPGWWYYIKYFFERRANSQFYF